MTHQKLLDLKVSSCTQDLKNLSKSGNDLNKHDNQHDNMVEQSLHVKDLYRLDAIDQAKKKAKKEKREKRKKKEKKKLQLQLRKLKKGKHKQSLPESQNDNQNDNDNESIVSWNRSNSNLISTSASVSASASGATMVASSYAKSSLLLLEQSAQTDYPEDTEENDYLLPPITNKKKKKPIPPPPPPTQQQPPNTNNNTNNNNSKSDLTEESQSKIMDASKMTGSSRRRYHLQQRASQLRDESMKDASDVTSATAALSSSRNMALEDGSSQNNLLPRSAANVNVNANANNDKRKSRRRRATSADEAMLSYETHMSGSATGTGKRTSRRSRNKPQDAQDASTTGVRRANSHDGTTAAPIRPPSSRRKNKDLPVTNNNPNNNNNTPAPFRRTKTHDGTTALSGQNKQKDESNNTKTETPDSTSRRKDLRHAKGNSLPNLTDHSEDNDNDNDNDDNNQKQEEETNKQSSSNERTSRRFRIRKATQEDVSAVEKGFVKDFRIRKATPQDISAVEKSFFQDDTDTKPTPVVAPFRRTNTHDGTVTPVTNRERSPCRARADQEHNRSVGDLKDGRRTTLKGRVLPPPPPPPIFSPGSEQVKGKVLVVVKKKTSSSKENHKRTSKSNDPPKLLHLTNDLL